MVALLRQQRARLGADPLEVLMFANVAISTGNLVFVRALLDAALAG